MNTISHTIDGACLARMLTGGAAKLAAHVDELNALNVFPVADGDTGTNMLKTMEGGLTALSSESTVSETAARFARGVLLGARGNSGVILSQIFAGIQEGLANCETADAAALAKAFQNGITRSYAAVQNPTEGTILTVFRESAEYAAAHIDADASVEDFLHLHIEEAHRSLALTKERLAVLAQANVIDSGAAGYVYIAEGMYEALSGKEISYTVSVDNAPAADIDRFTRDSVLEFGYCTEFLLRLTTAKVDPDTFDIQTVLSLLTELGGESIVAYKQDDIVKVHVHTFTPGEILARVQAFGEFLTVKVENMSLGHSDTPAPEPQSKRPFSVVAVATGEGLVSLFSEMGADQIVSGGQSANPSIEEFLAAFRACNSDTIFVLPNNKNIVLAAKQAAALYEDAAVHVIETKSLMQGYSALSVLTPGITDIDALIAGAQRAAQSVADGEITKAVRDAVIDGMTIHEGDYMALASGTVAAVTDTAEDAVLRFLETADTDFCEIITLICGRDVSDDTRAQLTETIKEQYEDCDVIVYEGGQDIYDYYIGVE